MHNHARDVSEGLTLVCSDAQVSLVQFGHGPWRHDLAFDSFLVVIVILVVFVRNVPKGSVTKELGLSQ